MLKTKKQIEKWLDKHEVTNYTINDDLTVDVNRNVYLNNYSLTEIPVQFNVVKGHFWCYRNSLTSLVGCPKIVKGNFYCAHNDLTSLEGSPKEVNGDFFCSCNKLESLKRLPEIHGYLFCDKDLYQTREYKIYKISRKLKELV